MEAGQDWQGEDAAMVEENVPAGQETQTELLFAPIVGENLCRAELQRHGANDAMRHSGTHVPALQGVHTDTADAFKVVENVPGGHGTQVAATR